MPPGMPSTVMVLLVPASVSPLDAINGISSSSVEEARRPKRGELGPLPPTDDLVGDRRAEKRRHRYPAMGDGDVVAGSPRHRSDRREMVAGDGADGDAHRLGLDLANRGQQLPGTTHHIARLRH